MISTPSSLRTILLQVITPHYHRDVAVKNMRELEQLVETFGAQIIDKDIQHRVHPHQSTYIGPGKLEELATQVAGHKIDVVIINDIVNSGQLFRLEKALWKVNHRIKVWDRVDLILNIFEQHAHTKEAKLQIELARIAHQGPRVYGLGKTALSRQGGGIGTRGSGETNIEQEKRVIRERTQRIKSQLAQLASRKRERVRWRTERGLGPVALVGYTSAGKTSTFNALTGKDKQTHASLFTTLDTVVGKMKTPESDMPVLLSDTIGFIENLPPALIQAFQSTLIESLEAKLLLHVADVSDPRLKQKIAHVDQILDEMELSQPRILVLNKIDLIDSAQLEHLTNLFVHRPHLCISATTRLGLDELRTVVRQQLLDME